MEGCIGEENKKKIDELEHQVTELKLQVKYMDKNMVTKEVLHQLEITVTEIKGALKEMENNHIENRKNIESLFTTMTTISEKIEDLKVFSINLENMTKRQVKSEKQIDNMAEMMAELIKRDDNRITNTIKRICLKNKITKTISTIVLAVFIVSLLSLMYNLLAFFSNSDTGFINDIINLINAFKGG